jgi:uncharacterized damage-inducible protein DinB
MAQTTKPFAPTATPLSTRAHFLEAYRREHATTMRVLRAYPPAEAELRPHERSQTARQLAWAFVIGQGAIAAALKKEFALPAGAFPPPPESWQSIIDMFAAPRDEIVDLLEGVRDDELYAPVRFVTGPGQTGEIPTLELLWFMLCDQIHHRGQLSVYTRLAGAKVPSIYGPSADEPWF